MQKLEKMEILAPAGSREAFFAAVNSGADAVYLAAKNFGARAYADNFALEDLAGLLRWAHLRGVAVYLAMNTLLRDDELPAALAMAVQLHNLGADALIVQDWGFAHLLHKYYPEITLNVSTQMTLHNAAAVFEAEKAGFARVILAREVSLADIAAIKAETTAELEVFGHGALCICFSGQCLFSSLVGGRSGNRGRCAQPCRLKYQLWRRSDGRSAAELIGEAGHLLSPRDLNTIDLLPELAAAGVCSLKIEGRMKRPEYVAAVTAAYAAARRGQPYAAQNLRQAFNRDFTQAYLRQQPGADLMSYERPNNRGVKLGRLDCIADDALILKPDKATLNVQVGDGLEVWVSRGGRQGFVVKELQYLADGRICLPLAGLQGALQLSNLAVGDRVFKTADSALQNAGEAAAAAYDTLPLRLHFVGRLGQAPRLQASYTDGQGNVCSAAAAADYQIPAAEKRPADLALLQKQLGRLGGSGWYLAELTADLDEGVMLPASVLNQLRRDALAALEEKILQGWERQHRRRVIKAGNKALDKQFDKELTHLSAPKKAAHTPPRLAALVTSLPAARAVAAAGADLIYWRGWQQRFAPPPTTDDLQELAALGAYGVLPTIALQAELPLWRQRLTDWRWVGLAGVLVNNLWGFALLAEMPDWQPQLVADFGLNSFNTPTALAWRQQYGKTLRTALSRELNSRQLETICRKLAAGGAAAEVQAFGNLEVMNSRHCPLGALGGGHTSTQACSGFCRTGEFYLRDEKGFCFPVYGDEFCRSHIYNGYQLCLLEELPILRTMPGLTVLRLDLQYYNSENAAQVCRIWRQALGQRTDDKDELADLKRQLLPYSRPGFADKFTEKFTKGHFFRGVE